MNLKQRAAVIAEAKTWLRTPYHEHARIKGAGADCLTLLMEVYRAAGVIGHVDPGNYNPRANLHRSEETYLEGLLQHGCVEIGRPDPGDVALFQFGRLFWHGAIVVAWPLVIHALSEPGGGCVQYGDATIEPLAGRAVRFFTLREKAA